MKKLDLFFGLLLVSIVLPFKAQNYITHKYSGFIDQRIGKYVLLCEKIEKKHICNPNFSVPRFLAFAHPCIVRCYNEIIEKHSVKPLYYLWEAYKEGDIDCEKDKFIYEVCHLIFILFERFIVNLVSDLTGESSGSLQTLFDHVESTIPVDDLIDILEQCYTKLNEIINHVDVTQPQWHGKISKKWVILAVSIVVIIKKIYSGFYQKKPLEQIISANS